MDAQGASRGRLARKPWKIPISGWKDVLLRTKDEIGADHVGLVAAGCAFYALLALFPGLAAAISVWGLVADPDQIVRQLDGFTAALPPEAASLIQQQAADAAEADTGALLTVLFGILLGVYSASKGMKSLTEGMNIVYDETEDRGFFHKLALNLGLTLATVLGFVGAAFLVVVVPAALGTFGLPAFARVAAVLVQWAVLIGGAFAAFALLYRFGPSRDDARWEWLSGGAFVAVILWIVGSFAFSIYVANFASYNATYGAMGGVVILLMWLYLSAFAVLLGAEVNAELERQTRRDTTVGKREPLGERGAHAADTVGEAKG